MTINVTNMGAFGDILSVLWVILGICAPLVVLALVAYWVIRLAVRHGMTDALRNTGNEGGVGDGPRAAPLAISPKRRALYFVAGSLMVVGLVLMMANLPAGQYILVVGVGLMVVYVVLFAIDAARKA